MKCEMFHKAGNPCTTTVHGNTGFIHQLFLSFDYAPTCMYPERRSFKCVVYGFGRFPFAAGVGLCRPTGSISPRERKPLVPSVSPDDSVRNRR